MANRIESNWRIGELKPKKKMANRIELGNWEIETKKKKYQKAQSWGLRIGNLGNLGNWELGIGIWDLGVGDGRCRRSMVGIGGGI